MVSHVFPYTFVHYPRATITPLKHTQTISLYLPLAKPPRTRGSKGGEMAEILRVPGRVQSILSSYLLFLLVSTQSTYLTK